MAPFQEIQSAARGAGSGEHPDQWTWPQGRVGITLKVVNVVVTISHKRVRKQTYG